MGSAIGPMQQYYEARLRTYLLRHPASRDAVDSLGGAKSLNHLVFMGLPMPLKAAMAKLGKRSRQPCPKTAVASDTRDPWF